MTIGVMGAMAEEVRAIAEAMETDRLVTSGGRDFHLGTLGGHNLVLAMSRCGKVAAATTAAHLILDHGAGVILFTGLAGALDPSLRIGDVVIADRLWQHDLDASPIFPPLEIPMTGKSFLRADPAWRERLRVAACEHLEHGLGGRAEAQALRDLGITSPRVVVGDVATGDQFIGSAEAAARVRQRVPSAMCAEMEGAAAAQVCDDHAVPFAAVRTISDSADHDAPVDFARFLSGLTGAYAIGIIGRALR